MKRRRLLSFLLTGVLAAGSILPYLPGAAQDMATVFAAEDTREWTNNPGIFQVNRERARATFYRYDSVEQALAADKESSGYYQLLNGDDWKFSWAVKPSERIAAQDEDLFRGAGRHMSMTTAHSNMIRSFMPTRTIPG